MMCERYQQNLYAILFNIRFVCIKIPINFIALTFLQQKFQQLRHLLIKYNKLDMNNK